MQHRKNILRGALVVRKLGKHEYNGGQLSSYLTILLAVGYSISDHSEITRQAGWWLARRLDFTMQMLAPLQHYHCELLNHRERTSTYQLPR